MFCWKLVARVLEIKSHCMLSSHLHGKWHSPFPCIQTSSHIIVISSGSETMKTCSSCSILTINPISTQFLSYTPTPGFLVENISYQWSGVSCKKRGLNWLVFYHQALRQNFTKLKQVIFKEKHSCYANMMNNFTLGNSHREKMNCWKRKL